MRHGYHCWFMMNSSLFLIFLPEILFVPTHFSLVPVDADVDADKVLQINVMRKLMEFLRGTAKVCRLKIRKSITVNIS